jgi:predicted GTPase
MGYSEKQMAELEETINAAECDAVVIGTPIDLARHLKINKPTVRVNYELEEVRPGEIRKSIEKLLKEAKFAYRRS